MYRIYALALLLLLGAGIIGCDKTVIDKNPAPIVWGKISFFPTTAERSKDKTVYNNITFSGYGKKGTIERVTVTKDETVVENVVSDFYSANKQIWKGASGEYQEALNLIMSGKYEQINLHTSLAGMPKFKIASFEGVGERWKYADGDVSTSSTKVKNLSFNGLDAYEAANVAINEKGQPPVQIASASISRVFIPDDVEEHPENIILNNLRLADLKIGGFDAKVGQINLNYDDYKLKFGIDQASVPGSVLKPLGVANPPALITGSLDGKGQLNGQQLTADASLTLKDLLDATADIKGDIGSGNPERINFSLTDNGALNYISNELKGQLALLALFVPDGQLTLVNFLSKPGQTLDGSVTFGRGIPSFKFNVR